MDHFLYKDGVLHAEDVPLSEIAASVGTPFYVYSSATLTRHYRVFEEALAGMDHLICYAMKANSNQAVIRLMGDLGAGMDVVSGGGILPCNRGRNTGRTHCFFWCWENARRNGAGALKGYSPVQRGKRT